jgi:hypothetical protein
MFFFLFISAGMAQQEKDIESSGETGQNESTVQAQETLASLFGRGSKMPELPQVKGSIALPNFDSSNMAIDESSLNKVED